MNTKTFSQRFNVELSKLGFPEEHSEKTKAVAIVFDVSRHLANAMIFGNALPSQKQLTKIASVLEVCPLWLSGTTDRKKVFSVKELEESEQ